MRKNNGDTPTAICKNLDGRWSVSNRVHFVEKGTVNDFDRIGKFLKALLSSAKANSIVLLHFQHRYVVSDFNLECLCTRHVEVQILTKMLLIAYENVLTSQHWADKFWNMDRFDILGYRKCLLQWQMNFWTTITWS